MIKEQGNLYSRYLADESLIRDEDFINLGTRLENIKFSLQSLGRDFYELSTLEIEAVAKLFSRERPISVVELIHFKIRVIPLLFLDEMNEDTDDLDLLSDIELANVIYTKFKDREYINKAKKWFLIEE